MRGEARGRRRKLQKIRCNKRNIREKGKVHAIFCNFDAFLGEEGFAPGSQIEAMNLCCRWKKQSFTLPRGHEIAPTLSMCIFPSMHGWLGLGLTARGQCAASHGRVMERSGKGLPPTNPNPTRPRVRFVRTLTQSLLLLTLGRKEKVGVREAWFGFIKYVVNCSRHSHKKLIRKKVRISGLANAA